MTSYHPDDAPLDGADRAAIRAAALRDAAGVAGARDLLVVRMAGPGDLALVEAVVCGEHWQGRVDLELDREPLIRQAMGGESIVRSSPRRPRRVCGPYWAPSAAFVPRHRDTESVVVVLGGLDRQPSDADGVEAADTALAVMGEDRAPRDGELHLLTILEELLRGSASSVAEAIDKVADGARAALCCDAALVWVAEGERVGGCAPVWSRRELAAVCDLVAEAFASGETGLPALDVAGPPHEPGGRPWSHHTVVELPAIGQLVLFSSRFGARPWLELADVQSHAQAVAAGVLGAALARERLAAHSARARARATRDGRTGLLNRLGWDELLHREDAGVSCPSGIVALSVDARANGDRPDALVRRVGRAVRSTLRTVDAAARVGGGEFRIVVRDADAAVCTDVARRLRAALEPVTNGRGAAIGIGWGVAPARSRLGTALDVAEAMADQDLRRAATGAP